ncbi:flagellar assembly protein FliW [Siminovitchia sp. FSL W7-1587]|uniref:flagellar assembly protein FliW n=1 Tax=Siminovitchia sp. FSL W7-1587 TaxID=2954699 RepID=UPI0030D05E57
MNITTKYHGAVKVNEREILHFTSGIPGFPDEKQFVVLPLEDTGFAVMQSVATSDTAFIVTEPFLFFPEYDFKLEEQVIDQLELRAAEDVRVYIILTVHDPFEKTTGNLQAPVIINTKNRQAKQVVLNDGVYKTRHPLFGQKVEG